MRELTRDEVNRLVDFVHASHTAGTKFAGMTFEDGIMAVLDILDDNQTVEETIE